MCHNVMCESFKLMRITKISLMTYGKSIPLNVSFVMAHSYNKLLLLRNIPLIMLKYLLNECLADTKSYSLRRVLELCFLLSSAVCISFALNQMLYLAEAAFPEHLVQNEVIDGESGLVLLWDGVQRLFFFQRLSEAPVCWSFP